MKIRRNSCKNNDIISHCTDRWAEKLSAQSEAAKTIYLLESDSIVCCFFDALAGVC